MSIHEEAVMQRTSDFNVCAVLLYFGHQLIEIDRREPRRCVFVLSQTEESSKTVEQFFDEHLLVEPKRFIAIQKDLKSRIYI